MQLQIVSHFVQQKEYSLALPLLEDVTKRYPNDAALLSAYGRLFIQIGIISEAETKFQAVESLSPSEQDKEAFDVLVEMNKYVLYLW